MNKKAIFFILTCLLLIASITYIICNKREQVPPMLVWEDQEYYVTNEPAKAEEVGQNLVRRKLKQQKPTKDSESSILEEKTEVFEMILEEEDKRLPILVKEPNSEECRVVRPMLK